MKDGQDKIDNLFKKRLEDPGHNLAYNEDDWDALEQMLDKGGKKPIVLWLPILGAVAALALLFVGWWFFKPVKIVNDANQQVAVKPAPKNTRPGTSGGAIKQTGSAPQIPLNEVAGTTNAIKHTNDSKSFFTLSADGPRRNTAGQNGIPAVTDNGFNSVAVNGKPVDAQVNVPKQDTTPPSTGIVTGQGMIANAPVVTNRDTTPPPAVNGVANNNGGQAVVATAPVVSTTTPDKATGKPVRKTIKSLGGGMRPQFAIGVIASSDINGVNSLGNNKVGSNYGMTFSVGIKKLTISTGAIYSVKPYTTSFSNYNTGSNYVFPQIPSDITADCRMLDIPLNVSYRVYKAGRNKFALGTGVSSYLMLHENYKYSYASTSATPGPANYIVQNPKNYLLSAVNFSATFERQLNSKFSLSVQPYMKVPLSTVGYSQVNLHTAGVAVGFNWNINSFTKP